MNAAVREMSEAIAPDLLGGLPGLVWAYRFGADGRAETLPVTSPIDVAGIGQNGDWLWLHFAQNDARAAAFIARLPLPPRAIDALLSRDEHLNLHLEGETAFGVLADWQHAIEDEFAPDAAQRIDENRNIARLHFALRDGLVVSTRRAALYSAH